MIETIAASIVSFIGTNIDNIFVMVILYVQVGDKLKKAHIVIGQYLGLGILVGISLLGAYGLHFVPDKYVGVGLLLV